MTVDLHGGAVSLSDVTQTLLLQLGDLWDLIFTTSRTESVDGHVTPENLQHVTNHVSVAIVTDTACTVMFKIKSILGFVS